MENSTNTGQSPQKKSRAKKLLIGVGVLGLSLMTFSAIDYFSKQKAAKKTKAEPAPKPKAKTKTSNKPAPKAKPKAAPKPKAKPKPQPKATTPPPAPDPAKTTPADTPAFPLVKGSKGDKVKNVQEALIRKYGKPALPKDGANGVFGAELEAALKKLNLPDKINETLYHVLVQPVQLDFYNTARLLNSAANSKNHANAIKILKTLKSVEDYKNVNKFFLSFFTNGVRQKLVGGMLGAFKTEAQKDSIRFEFTRMGLKYDGNKWSLSGLDDSAPTLITTGETRVWRNSTTSVPVPANMVLGRLVVKRGDHTVFENEGLKFLIESRFVKEYKQ